MNMPNSSNIKRESIIAALLLVFCSLALVLSLFTIQVEPEAEEDGQLVSNLIGDRVAVIGLEGMIFDSFYTKTPFASNVSSAAAKRELQKAIEDKNVKAVLLRVNSPGGTVGASQEIYKLVKKLRAKEKPVVISMGDVCASGCYYIASAADKVLANPGTLTGSIGVISQGLNFTDLLFKLGVKNQTFKAGKYKDIASSQRPMTAEEKKIMQNLLDDSYDQFLDDIEKGRGIERAKLEEIAQGLIYTGRQAVEVNLIDMLGDYEKAKKVTREILKESGYDKASKISFAETWGGNKLSSLEELFGFSLSEKMGSFLGSLVGVKSNKVNSILGAENVSVSKYQPLWLLP